MSVLKYLLPTVAAAVAISTSGIAQTPENESDQAAVKDFIRAKRSVMVREKGGDLSISGDIRFEYQSVTESIEGANQRGSGSGNANHAYDAEVNLMFDYRADKTWGHAKIEFDNNAGNISGESGSVKLERAFAGYNVLEEDTARFDVEFGRRNMYDIFDSKVQFASRFDGILLRYANSIEAVGDLYLNGGAFIIDDVVDHYGWAIEAGLMDIADSGLYGKYSYVDWDNSGVTRAGSMTDRSYESRNSQFTFGYQFTPEVLRTDLELYGAYLWNHAAKKQAISNSKKKSRAWYAGVKLGKVEFAGDWSIDANWQHVAAQAVIDTDVNGIGRGNVNTNTYQGSGDVSTARGNANYKGYAIEAAYALTDQMTFGMEYESSNAADKKIGGRNSYHKFEVEMVYGF